MSLNVENHNLDTTSDLTEHNESAEKKAQDPNTLPFSNGFFDKDPITSKARAEYLKLLVAGTMLVSVAIWAVLSIYWGALWKTEDLIHNLEGWVVDFDGGEVGSAVTQYFAAIHAKDHLSWRVQSADLFPNGPGDLAHAVVEEKCWVAIAINPGATNTLTQAVDTANATYNSTLAVTAFGNEARNENAYSFLIVPNLQQPLQQISQQFANQNAQQLASRTNLQAILSQAPSLVTQPLGYTIDNLRPFDIPVAAAVDFVGLIYLLILSFIIAAQQLNARLQSGIQRRLRMKSLLILRIVAPIITYFWISLMYSALSQAFNVPFNRKFGHSGFLVYWMMSWCGMMALGLALEAALTLLTMKFIPFFLILWIITNVSVCFYPIPVLPSIYRYGYAAPFYNVSNAVRTILFNTRNQVGLNFGVQLAWVGISCLTLPLFQWYVRRQEMAAWRKEHVRGE
ncbi:hypothetical protein PILCRDRAFT_761064 [Piloderma croceum F 1598]|uniref:DUF3533 domain-containing protein n=1 Tax=Piloderma croceum (strain F 1598) TaxID=765440 RepID=A0A0C3CQC6_PILCF|nr:hypothetical protein PILCRDRAFT_761064 [Piloderma croceum F 1598]